VRKKHPNKDIEAAVSYAEAVLLSGVGMPGGAWCVRKTAMIVDADYFVRCRFGVHPGVLVTTPSS